jgi:cell shape-determining protein MreD
MAFFNSILVDVTSIYGVNIDLAMILVTVAALYFGESLSIWFAILLGIVSSTQRLEIMPWEMMIFVGIAIGVNQISARLNFESIASKLILLTAALIAHNILLTSILSFENLTYSLVRYILPGVVYSLIPGWIFFMFGNFFAGFHHARS